MTTAVTRRGALAALAGLVLASGGLDQAFAAPGRRVSRIHVDVSRLRARRGDPTARWVAEDMPQAVARALGARFARGAPGGAVLNVHVDDVLLPRIHRGGVRVIDEISGFVLLSRPGSPPLRRAIRTVTPFRARAVDQPLRVEANRRRVSVLVDRFAQQIPRDLGL